MARIAKATQHQLNLIDKLSYYDKNFTFPEKLNKLSAERIIAGLLKKQSECSYDRQEREPQNVGWTGYTTQDYKYKTEEHESIQMPHWKS